MKTVFAKLIALCAVVMLTVTAFAPTAVAAEEDQSAQHCWYANPGTNCVDIFGETYHMNCYPSSGESAAGKKSYWWTLVWCNGSGENGGD